MPLVMVLQDGKTTPQVFCDHCLKRIETHEEGLYLWTDESSEPPSFVHRRCKAAFTKRYGAMSSEDLSSFPIFLMRNLEMSDGDKDAQERALRSLGDL